MAQINAKPEDLAPVKMPEKKLERTPEGKSPTDYVVTAAQAAEMEPKLPDAGYAREEELAKRRENLEAAADSLNEAGNMQRIDPDSFDEDREILQHFATDPFTGDSDIEVDGRDNERYVYKWVQCEAPRTAPDKEVYKAKRFGWELVTPTLVHYRAPSGGASVPVGSNLSIHGRLNARYCGDTVLMWMTKERFHALQLLEEKARNRLKLGARAGTMHSRQGVIAHSELDDRSGYVRKLMQQGGPVRMPLANTVAGAMAQGLARNEFDERLRSGAIPGMEVKR